MDIDILKEEKTGWEKEETEGGKEGIERKERERSNCNGRKRERRLRGGERTGGEEKRGEREGDTQGGEERRGEKSR